MASLAALRDRPGVECLTLEDAVWLSGPSDETTEERLRALPDASRYRQREDGMLIPWGARLPLGRRPSGEWRPFAECIRAELPPRMRLPEKGDASWTRIEPKLVRAGSGDHADGQAQPDAGLIVFAAEWSDYAARVPAMRLAPLRFAASRDGRVLILGDPAPSLPGVRLWETDGILVESGWTWSPHVSSGLLRAIWEVSKDARLLWTTRHGVEVVREEDFVPARRAAARATMEGLSRARD